MTDSQCAASHHLNSSPIYVTINSQSWIPAETKARLLEWKIRYDLMEYAARGAPELSLDQIKAYRPRAQGITSKAGESLQNSARRWCRVRSRHPG